MTLDPASVAAADDKFYAKHANSHVRNGRRVPLSASKPEEDALRREWWQYYQAAADARAATAAPNQAPASSTPQALCPLAVPPESSACVRMNVVLFFDGTDNNMNQAKKPVTNIARLFSTARIPEGFSGAGTRNTVIYVEGIGTPQDATGGWLEDSMASQATGHGSQGVIEKAERGIREALRAIQGPWGQETELEVTLDVFGFSRGAAAARYFCSRLGDAEPSDQGARSMAKPKGPARKAPGRKPAAKSESDRATLMELIRRDVSAKVRLRLRLVGLYDTVSSYRLNVFSDVALLDDTSELHLDAIAAAEAVIQLASGDEHRKSFPLVGIESAGDRGSTAFLPGVHADVGGGYAEQESETVSLLVVEELDGVAFDGRDFVVARSSRKKALFEREIERVAEEGWCSRKELQEVGSHLVLERKVVRNAYEQVPLKVMQVLAAEAGAAFTAGVPQSPRVCESLQALERAIMVAVRRGELSTIDGYRAWATSDAAKVLLRAARGAYFHQSACCSKMGMQPQFRKDGTGFTDDPFGAVRCRRAIVG